MLSQLKMEDLSNEMMRLNFVPIVARRAAISILAINVRKPHIVTPPAKRNIDQNIRNNVRGVLPNCMMKSSSKNRLSNMGNVPSASFVCRLWVAGEDTMSVAER